MGVLAIFAIIALCLIAFLHFYWAFGGEKGIDMAIPTENGKALLHPGKLMTVAVGMALIGCAILTDLLSFHDLDQTPYRGYIVVMGWILSVVFILRGIGEFRMFGMFKRIKSTVFATYDTWLYTPFAFFIGIMFAVLTYNNS